MNVTLKKKSYTTYWKLIFTTMLYLVVPSHYKSETNQASFSSSSNSVLQLDSLFSVTKYSGVPIQKSKIFLLALLVPCLNEKYSKNLINLASFQQINKHFQCFKKWN